MLLLLPIVSLLYYHPIMPQTLLPVISLLCAGTCATTVSLVLVPPLCCHCIAADATITWPLSPTPLLVSLSLQVPILSCMLYHSVLLPITVLLWCLLPIMPWPH